MRSFLYTLIIASLFIAGCKKNSTTVTPPPGPATSKMNGTRIWMGTAGNSSKIRPPDAFMQLEVTVLSDTTVLCNYDTLLFKSIDLSSSKTIFQKNESVYPTSTNSSTLTYNSANNSMEYSSTFSNRYVSIGMDITTSAYKPNPSLKDYFPDIIGKRALAGYGYDSFIMPDPDDRMYDLHVDMTFYVLNDSTLTFDIDLLRLGDRSLHYKSTDNDAQTITFQTFHSYDFTISTLTYNYATHKLVFEQQFREVGWRKYVRLE